MKRNHDPAARRPDSLRLDMNILELTGVVFGGALLAGLIGSLTGLGGGIIITPLLTLVLGVDIHYAIGAALVSVIATSCGAASAYVREGLLEHPARHVYGGGHHHRRSDRGVAGVAGLHRRHRGSFSGLFFFIRPRLHFGRARNQRQPRAPILLRRASSWIPVIQLRMGSPVTTSTTLLGGTSVMLGAGMLSGLLGIGSGAFKVIAFDRIMRVPFKVSTTTSNFMIGVTAAASVGLYLQRGYIDPGLGMPVVLGVLCGSFLGARMLPGMKTSVLRHVFAVVIAVLAIEMIFHGLKGTV